MSQQKQQYLQSIRANSAYPVYRGFIGTIALLGYALAGLIGLTALVGGFGLMSRSFALGLLALVAGGVMAYLYYLLARFFREAALMLADLADSTVDSNSRPASLATGA
jgi:hypothetical protein